MIQQSNNQYHEGREIELLHESQYRESNNNIDNDGTGVDGVVSHTMEDDTRLADCMDDGGKTRFGQNNIRSTTSCICGAFYSNLLSRDSERDGTELRYTLEVGNAGNG